MNKNEHRIICPKLTAANMVSIGAHGSKKDVEEAYVECLGDMCGMYNLCFPNALNGVACVKI